MGGRGRHHSWRALLGFRSAPAAQAWSPFDPARSLHRPPPARLPTWIEGDYLAHNVSEFQRTGFHGALNYYRAVQPFFDLSGPYVGATITQPSYFIWGKADGLFPIYQLTEAKMRDRCPGLVGFCRARWRRPLGPARGGGASEPGTDHIRPVRPRRLTGFQAMIRPSEPPLTSSEKRYLFPNSRSLAASCS